MIDPAEDNCKKQRRHNNTNPNATTIDPDSCVLLLLHRTLRGLWLEANTDIQFTDAHTTA